ncbi:MAG: hypothetical protein QOF15_2309 [Mycobacterium sp.]|nr:hypothetical protein [Mycobacterium sp.]
MASDAGLCTRVRSTVVNPERAHERVQSGLRPPQQARSRAALQRILAAAEEVLVTDGFEEFTIARVAEHAGVSVGGVYRRFASKEHLIEAIKQALAERLEQAVAEALDKAESSLGGVVEAFTAALGETLNESGRVIPAILAGGRSLDPPEQGLRTITALQRRFVEAAAIHRNQIRHPDPATALDIGFRSVLAAGTHRVLASPLWPDGLTWRQWAREIADMTLAYLTAERQNISSAR